MVDETQQIIRQALESGNPIVIGLAVLVLLVQAANVITMVTPSTVDNKVLQRVVDVLNLVALNVFRNGNADDSDQVAEARLRAGRKLPR